MKTIIYNPEESIDEQVKESFVLYDSNFELNKKYKKIINNKLKEDILNEVILRNKKLANNLKLHNNDVIYNGREYMWIYINRHINSAGQDTTIRGYILDKNIEYSIDNEEIRPYDIQSEFNKNRNFDFSCLPGDKGWRWGKKLAGMLYMIDNNWISELEMDLNNFKVVHNMTEGSFTIPETPNLLNKILAWLKI